MRERKVVLQQEQTELFQRVMTPRWVDLAPEVRERTTKLLARLLQEHRERASAVPGAEVGDE